MSLFTVEGPKGPFPQQLTSFPGQLGNLVGHLNAPGFPGNLTLWPGGFDSNGRPGGLVNGSPGNPTVYSFYDFDPKGAGIAQDGTTLTLQSGNSAQYIKFYGCRFQSNSTGNYNISVAVLSDQTHGGSNITLSYCSIVPRLAVVSTIPNADWPSSSAGLQIDVNNISYGNYCIPAASCYQYGVRTGFVGDFSMDHCDVWGCQNAVDLRDNTAVNIVVDNCWIHDFGNDNSHVYHQDGPGQLGGGACPSNIRITNNTIASIGNTNALAFQGGTGSFNNIYVSGNYFSGFGNTIDMCHNQPGSTNLIFIDNTIGNDIAILNSPLYANFSAVFTQISNPTNLWRRNKVFARVGDTYRWSTSGQYMWPDGTLNTTDWVN